ncbi:MAG: sensor histidine kinase [Oliverpabstia sp.]
MENQKIRFQNRFAVEYHIDEKARSCILNKLLIQPIVENAVNHGFSQLNKDGLLIISAYISANTLVIEVADNGIGMDEETLHRLLLNINNPNPESRKKSIGLSNIQERIHLKYGDGFGLTVSSQKSNGTRVSVRIPANYQEEKSKNETEDLIN